MLSIRLRRAGTTKKPHYRVVVADSRAWRDGRFVEVLGHYDPRKDPVVVKIDAERAQYWIGKGAQPSDTVRSLLKKQSEAAKATAASRRRNMRPLLVRRSSGGTPNDDEWCAPRDPATHAVTSRFGRHYRR